MGGSILFTESATFSPSLYGLTTGKFINYIIIGGGGAGATGLDGFYRHTGGGYTDERAATSGGTNGGSSSIGNYVTVTGGTTSTLGVWNDADWDNDTKVNGGTGAGGWVPGRIFNNYQNGAQPIPIGTTSSSLTDRFWIYEDAGYRILRDATGTSDSPALTSYPIGNGGGSVRDGRSSYGAPNPYSLNQIMGVPSQGNDGVGYGAGGGGHQQMSLYNDYAAGYGGDCGEFKMGSFKLANTNDITITIGAGGTCHNQRIEPSGTFEISSTYSGRAGTQGAAMLFWD